MVIEKEVQENHAANKPKVQGIFKDVKIGNLVVGFLRTQCQMAEPNIGKL